VSDVHDLHDDAHDEAILAVAFGGADASGEVLARLAACDACLTVLARAVEDATVLGAGPRAARLGAILDEALVWRAIALDAGGPGPVVGAGAGADKRRGRG